MMMRRYGLLALLLACACAVAEAPPAAQRRSDSSYYVPMRDGVRIAVNLYFPNENPPSGKLPAVLLQTRYGRAGLGSWSRTQRWLQDGIVVVAVDTRGSTASFGTRMTELSPEEVADIDDIVRHVAALPWSDGRVLVAGQSYLADTADLATSRPLPQIIGGVIHEVDFDIYANLIAPGGVINRGFLSSWGTVTRGMDIGRNDLDSAGPARDCLLRAADCPALYPTLQPVDDDRDLSLLRSALGAKQRWLATDLLNITFRDDKGHNGFSLSEISPVSAIEGLRRERKPLQYWGSWMDGGTAEAVLSRYRSLPDVPMEVWITPNDHRNYQNADPFFPDTVNPHPALAEQQDLQSRFVRDLLAGKPPERRIHYYVLGSGEFRTTTAWPVADARPLVMHLAPNGGMTESPGASTTLSYEVDPTVGTGTRTRWATQMGVPPAYPDRRELDRRLRTFDSTPVSVATEIVGTPVMKLVMASLTDDPAVFAYLEDVAPDGRVTYLTEGVFRAIHRRPADPATLPYDQGPAPHSFLRRDAELVSPGEVMTLEFAMLPTAALIRPGHRLRLAIAGADVDWFGVQSKDKPERFDIRVGSGGSRLVIPTRPWR